MKQNNKEVEKHLLSVKDLVVEYTSDGEVIHAVNGVSFDLDKGKTIGLVGETGAGKTTIAKAILRILPDNSVKICSGEVYIDDEDILKKSEKDMRNVRGNLVSMIFQDPMTALNPTMRIGNQISEVIKVHKNISEREAEKQAIEILKMVGIPEDRFREYPHQFSGGMKQRVVIAMALACEPRILLADEPTTALDVTIQAQVRELIKELKIKNETAMILITHDLSVVAETCDDVAIVYAGQIMEYGNKFDIFDHPTHPYTIGLFGAVPDLNKDEEWLHPIDGMLPDPTSLPEGCPFQPRCPKVIDECKKMIKYIKTEDGHYCRCCNIEGQVDRDGIA